MSNRVVITGMGAVSPLGLTVSELWEGLVSGKSGVDYITLFDATALDTKFAAEVKGFDPTTYVDRKEARRMDRFTQFALAATLQALDQAKLKIDQKNADDIGVLFGSGIGGLMTMFDQIKTLLEKGPDRVSPFTAPMMIGDAAPGQVSIIVGAKGPNFTATSACSSGSDAIGEAYEIIKRGDAKAMIAGGAEAVINAFAVAAFNAARALSTRNDAPQQASRPFDSQRDGFVLAEGAATFILEDLSFALQRGAPILGEIISYGATSDAYHITQPDENGDGAARAMSRALKKANLKPSTIDYINAHGTSTPLNDKTETLAIKTVFGEHAYRIPISSTKSMLGHLLGAAGAIESVVCLLAINHGIVPPTINLTNPDPECDLDYVPNVARQAKINIAMTNSFGFGGHNSVLIFRRHTEAIG